jgi:hypothetical protein
MLEVEKSRHHLDSNGGIPNSTLPTRSSSWSIHLLFPPTVTNYLDVVTVPPKIISYLLVPKFDRFSHFDLEMFWRRYPARVTQRPLKYRALNLVMVGTIPGKSQLGQGCTWRARPGLCSCRATAMAAAVIASSRAACSAAFVRTTPRAQTFHTSSHSFSGDM